MPQSSRVIVTFAASALQRARSPGEALAANAGPASRHPPNATAINVRMRPPSELAAQSTPDGELQCAPRPNPPPGADGFILAEHAWGGAARRAGVETRSAGGAIQQ